MKFIVLLHLGSKNADLLTGFPTWLKGVGEEQFSTCGVTFNTGYAYNMFIVYSPTLSATRIRVNRSTNISTQTSSEGFQLTNFWGYFTETNFPSAEDIAPYLPQ